MALLSLACAANRSRLVEKFLATPSQIFANIFLSIQIYIYQRIDQVGLTPAPEILAIKPESFLNFIADNHAPPA